MRLGKNQVLVLREGLYRYILTTTAAEQKVVDRLSQLGLVQIEDRYTGTLPGHAVLTNKGKEAVA